MEDSIAANLAAIRGRMETAAGAAGRPTETVSLVAVSKTQPAEAVRAALNAGQRAKLRKRSFGSSR